MAVIVTEGQKMVIFTSSSDTWPLVMQSAASLLTEDVVRDVWSVNAIPFGINIGIQISFACVFLVVHFS